LEIYADIPRNRRGLVWLLLKYRTLFLTVVVVKGKVFPPESSTDLDLFVDPVTLLPSSEWSSQ